MVRSDGQVGRWFHGEHGRHVRQLGRVSSSRSQAPGLGFPRRGCVVVFCLATGVVLESAIGPARGKKTGETPCFAAFGTAWTRATSSWLIVAIVPILISRC